MNKYAGKSLEELNHEIDKLKNITQLDYISNPELMNDSADLMEAFAYVLLDTSDELRKTKEIVENSALGLFTSFLS